MSIWKVLTRNIKTGRQQLKKVYEADSKFEKYGKEIIRRYSEREDVEVYTMSEDEQWIFQYEVKAPRTLRELKKMQIERNYRDTWFEYRAKEFKI